MKTMRTSYNDVMQELDESYIEELCWTQKKSRGNSRIHVEKKVWMSINPPTYHRLKLQYILGFLLLIMCVSSLSIYAISSLLKKASLIDDSTRGLIGTEVRDTNYILYKDGKYMDKNGNEIKLDELSEITQVPSSRIVKEIEIPSLKPLIIVEFPVSSAEKNTYITPEIIMPNASPAILTQPDGSGWVLSEGAAISYSFEKYPSVTVDDQLLQIGIVKDGIMYDGIVYDNLTDTYQLTVSESGEYYIYLLNVSSDYLSLKNGNLSVKF